MSNDSRLVVSLSGLKDLGITYCNQQLLRLEAAGKFPARLSLGGGRAVCFLMSEIRDYLAQRASTRAADAAERSRAARAGVARREQNKRTKAPEPAGDLP